MGDRNYIGGNLADILAKHSTWLESNGKLGERANLKNANLNNAMLSGAMLDSAMLNGASLKGARLKNASMAKAEMIGAMLRGARMQKANLAKADLRSANLEESNMSSVNLNQASLYGSYLKRAFLAGADLRKADASTANFTESNLKGAKLDKASLNRAKLIDANLENANLRNTDLRKADLSGANLVNANFENAFFSETKFKSRDDLASADKIVDYEGIIFSEYEEERFEGEREDRKKRAANFTTGEENAIILTMPFECSPSQLGRVLTYTAWFYEGVRLAYTIKNFDTWESLYKKALLPDLYGASKDEEALKLKNVSKGSWVFSLVQDAGLIGLLAMVLYWIINNEALKDAGEYLKYRQKNALLKQQIKQNELQNELILQETSKEDNINKLITPEECKDLDDSLMNHAEAHEQLALARDRLDERHEAAVNIGSPITFNLNVILKSENGSLEIAGKKVLPIDDLGNNEQELA